RRDDEGWDECDIPESEVLAPAPSSKSLFRLLKFARPHLRLIVAGFLLTLAATTANQVPPYLTAPLVDKVLDPYQKRVAEIQASTDLDAQAKAASVAEVRSSYNRMLVWYLAAFGGAAVLAWLLSWGQGIVL